MKSIYLPLEEAQNILWETEYKKEGKVFWAIPSEVILDTVKFDLREKSEINAPSFIKKWFLSLRAISLTSMAIPTFHIFTIYFFMGKTFNTFNAIAAFVIPCLLLLATNVLNDVYDHLKLIDLPGSIGGSGVIQKGWIKPRELKSFAYTLLVIAAILAIPILLSSPIFMGILAVVTLIAVLGYSGKPFSFKYKALGDVLVFLCCGPLLTLGYGYAVFQNAGSLEVILGTIYGLAACAILHANNINDIEADTSRGAKTLASLIGFKGSITFMALLYTFTYFAIFLLYLNNFTSLFQILPSLIALFPILRLLNALYKAKKCNDLSIQSIRFDTPVIHLLLGVLLCLGHIFMRKF
ncbi:MAG: prenyltransferase [Bacteriovoracaceae bacterium]